MKRIWFLVAALAVARVVHANPEMEAQLPGGATMVFVWIEPGTFLMGSAGDDNTRLSSETPQHEVTLTQGYWLGKYEVTQAQWESVTGANPSKYIGPDHPVETVRWTEVQEFIGALNEAAGATLYRLPTEAEWEYACRAGTTSPYYFGDTADALGDYAWYASNNLGDFPAGTKAVGLKLANAWGLYDMLGNVYEWCQNGYEEYTEEAQVNPLGPATALSKPFRGGHFYGNDRAVRSAVRSYNGPEGRDYWLGARLLRVEPQPTGISAETWGQLKRSSDTSEKR